MHKHSKLADMVVRVSEFNCGAGYDVESFEEDGTPRYIEVKSSVGTKLEFEWSLSEQTCAKKFGRLYYIYFVPLSHMVADEIKQMIIIRDPILKIKQGSLQARASSWTVSANGSAN